MENRQQVKEYALSICLPLFERTANRRLHQSLPTCADNGGYTPTFLENFCRPLWGIAPILEGGEELYITVDGAKRELCGWIREVLAEDTRSGKETSWDRYRSSMGDFLYANQLATELAGLMVGVFFAKSRLWDPYEPTEKQRIADWLYEVAVVAFDDSWPNNHYWFPMLILLVLKRLGYRYSRTDAILLNGLQKLDQFYLGNGWYKDGEFGRFDYYIAWSHHYYPLLWTLLETEDFPQYQQYRQKYLERTNAFLDYYAHFFDDTGRHVAMGRSLSYRFAASAIFPMAALAGCEMDWGLGRNIMLRNIGFFEQNCPVEGDGVFGPGFGYTSTGFVENYTSDGGSYWCCKAFTCLLLEEDHPFWNAPARKIPVEKADYLLPSGMPDIHISLWGDQRSGSVTLFNNTANYVQNDVQQHQFNDMAAYYGKFAYNSKSGFGLSTPDNVSLDNMIALSTEDRTMCSHRVGFTDLGERDGALVSIHTPFSNDPDSSIKTWMVILLDGYHLRVHQIKLSRPYFVQEGGFSLGLETDYKKAEIRETGILLSNEDFVSYLAAKATVPVDYSIGQTHPGLHSHAPLAVYPKYQTKALCGPGAYIFASVFRFSTSRGDTPPYLSLAESQAEALYGGRSYVVKW